MKYRYREPHEMKDSGVEWLGMIPKEWGVGKIKYKFRIGRGRVISQQELDDNGKYPVYSSQTLNNGCLGYINSYDFSKKLITWTTDGANAGTIFLRDGKYNCTNVCGTLEASDKNNSLEYYFYYLSFSAQYYKRPDTNGAKIMNNEMANILALIPSENKQKIADFLDLKTAEFDEIIEKKEKLIEKLEEAKKSLISEVVTGKKRIFRTPPSPSSNQEGVNSQWKLENREPHEMKDSGVEWLGMIPEEWDRTKIKRLSRIGRGASPRPIDNPDFFDDNGEYAWTRIADVSSSGKYLEKTIQRMSDLGANLSVKLEPGKLFLSIAGSVGKPCISKIKACIHDGFVYFPDLSKQKIELLYTFFENGQCYLGLGKLGTQLNLNRETVGNIDIVYPANNDELNMLLNFVNNKTAEFDSLIQKNKGQIEKLKEAKQSLISEAVTGKIEVL